MTSVKISSIKDHGESKQG